MSKKYIYKILCFATFSHDAKGNSPKKAAISASELKEPSLKRKVGIQNIKAKRRKWYDDYFKYCSFLPQSQETSFDPSSQFMFCNVTYGNNSLAPSKLCSHLQNKHAIHQNKPYNFSKTNTTICASSNLPCNPWLQTALVTKNLYSFPLSIDCMCL